jgi:diacylglycerol kinase family enzyme
LSLAIANGPYTGRGMLIAPEARLDDGLLDVVVFRGFGPWRLGLHLLGILFGRRSDPRIRTYRARHIRVDSHRRLPVRADSRDLGVTPVELRVAPAAAQAVIDHGARVHERSAE